LHFEFRDAQNLQVSTERLGTINENIALSFGTILVMVAHNSITKGLMYFRISLPLDYEII